jgi:DNA polymerase III epsilon subunit-like protein
MNGRYVLDGHTAVPCNDLLEWGRLYESQERHVARTELNGGVVVSTVFLGLDHAFGGGPPILFETMVFGTDDDMCERYSTWNEAQAGHDAIVAALATPATEEAV